MFISIGKTLGVFSFFIFSMVLLSKKRFAYLLDIISFSHIISKFVTYGSIFVFILSL